MNKSELVEAIAKDADLSYAAAERVLNVTLKSIITAVADGDNIQLIGFGSFTQGKRSARVGRNPQTGVELQIPATKTIKFSAGKAFKDAVNKAAGRKPKAKTKK